MCVCRNVFLFVAFKSTLLNYAERCLNRTIQPIGVVANKKERNGTNNKKLILLGFEPRTTA